MKNLIVFAGISFLTILFLSCAVMPNLIEPSFIYPSIKTEGIAILPVGGEVDRDTRKDIGLSFEKELLNKYPNVKIVGVKYTGEKLANSNLIEEYNNIISTYQMTEIIDPVKFEKINNTIGFRYLVIPIVQSHDKQEVKGGNKYSITIESQVWDNLDKKIVFRILTLGEDTPSSWMFTKETLSDAAEKAIKTAVKAFPKPE